VRRSNPAALWSSSPDSRDRRILNKECRKIKYWKYVQILAARENQADWKIPAARENQADWKILAARENQADWNILAARENQADWKILAAREN
jgi:hypothetical protein